MAGLPLTRKEQQCLPVLVLCPGQGCAVLQERNIQLLLARRVRVEAALDVACRGLDLAVVGVVLHQRVHPVEVVGVEHLALREGQLVDRVVGDRVPVDQPVDDVLIGPERKHRGYGLHRGPIGSRQGLECWHAVDVPPRERSVLAIL